MKYQLGCPCMVCMECTVSGHSAGQAYLGGIEAQALEGLQKGLDGVIAGGKHVVRSGLVLVFLPRKLGG